MDGLLGRRLNGVSLAALAAFSLHQVAIAFGFNVLLLDSYLDPLCTVPVVLGIPSMLGTTDLAQAGVELGVGSPLYPSLVAGL